MASARTYYLGVGIDEYHDLPGLTHPVRFVQSVRASWNGSVDGPEPGQNCTRPEARTLLRDFENTLAGQGLVVIWSGHGSVEAQMLSLHTSDDEVSPHELAVACQKSGANQILLVLDTCYSGSGIDDIATVAARIRDEYLIAGDRAWFGVLVSCAGDQQARDGLFAQRFEKALTDGPDDEERKRRWSVHNRMICGDDLAFAIIEDWPDSTQHPEFEQRGVPRFLLPNPLWRDGAPPQIVEHLLRAARSGATASEQPMFCGRTAEINRVTGWVRARVPGVYAITGTAGTGKSAILGRVVSVALPDEREHIQSFSSYLGHDDPGVGSIAAHAHARGLTVERLAQVLDGQLTAAGLIPPTASGSARNAALLIGTLQQRHETGESPVVIAVDGLDEARGEAFAIAEDLVVRLSAFATVVVASRDIPRPDDVGLLGSMTPRDTVDLDSSDSRDSQFTAIHSYLVRRLTGVAATMDAVAVADALQTSRTDDTPFLLARIVADQVSARPVDTSVPNWTEKLASTVSGAFDNDLTHTAPFTGNGDTSDHLARGILASLTFAFGSGFPEREWILAASALTGAEITGEHITWVLNELGRYVVEDGEAGVAVYRLAHQSITELLRPAFTASNDVIFDPDATRIALALLDEYSHQLASNPAPTDDGYLWRYGYRHASAAGASGLEAMRRLAKADPDLRPDLARTALAFADAVAYWGRRADAVAPTEQAVHIYRSLADDNPAYLPDLAMSLNNLGICYSKAGQHTAALTTTEEAVQLRRTQAADNPAYLPNLASALNNLGNRYSKTGQHTAALTTTEEAVQLRRTLTADNPAHLPDLAMSLTNLGICYSKAGRPTADADEAWSRAHASLPEPTASWLLVRRSQYAEAGDHRTIGWLATATDSPDTQLSFAARDSARKHRRVAPSEWDLAWRKATGETPAWLTAATPPAAATPSPALLAKDTSDGED